MSFQDLCNKFESLNKLIKVNSDSLNTLSSFFRGFKKATEAYAQQVHKCSDVLTNSEETSEAFALRGFSQFFKEFAVAFTQLSTRLQLEIMQPLDLYSEQFSTIQANAASEAASIYKGIQKAQDKARRLQSKYYQSCEASDKLEYLLLREDIKEKQDKLNRQAAAQKSAAANALDSYQEAIQEVNLKWEGFAARMPTIMELLQQNEESRLNFMKQTLENSLKNSTEELQSILSAVARVAEPIAKIDPTADTLLLLEKVRDQPSELARESLVLYDSFRTVSEDTRKQYLLVSRILRYHVPSTEPIEPENDAELSARESTEGDQSAPTQEEYARLSELLHTSEGRVFFVEILESKKQWNQLTSENMMQTVAILKGMLTAMVMEDTPEPYVFCKIIYLAHTFHLVEGNQRKYMAEYLANHPIWIDSRTWAAAIEYTVCAKVEADKELMRKIQNQRIKTGLFGTLKNLAGRVPSNRKEFSLMNAEKSAMYLIISQFTYPMTNMGLPIPLASNVILELAKDVGLDSERTCTLLAELQAKQISPAILKLTQRCTHHKLEKKGRKYGQWLPVVYAAHYLPDLTEARLVCKAWAETLTPYFLKTQLRRSGVGSPLRSQVWKKKLLADFTLRDYGMFLGRVVEDPSVVKGHDETILLDVARSYRGTGIVPSDVLTNLLRVYAFFNSEVGYCQGMNYIAGTLYLQLQNEEEAFNCMLGLIDKFEMNELFMTNLPKLKQFFYQLDKLIALLLPEVHAKFSEVGVAASHFSSSWFITLYASVLQTSPDVLVHIWDMFIVKGWKSVFQVAITILSRISLQLVSGGFDEIMSILASISKIPAVFDGSFTVEAAQVGISNELLTVLEKEYLAMRSKANSY